MLQKLALFLLTISFAGPSLAFDFGVEGKIVKVVPVEEGMLKLVVCPSENPNCQMRPLSTFHSSLLPRIQECLENNYAYPKTRLEKPLSAYSITLISTILVGTAGFAAAGPVGAAAGIEIFSATAGGAIVGFIAGNAATNTFMPVSNPENYERLEQLQNGLKTDNFIQIQGGLKALAGELSKCMNVDSSAI